MKQQLYDKLSTFKEALELKEFSIPANAYKENRADGDPDPCKYCKFSMVCGRDQENGGLGDE